MGKPSLQDDRVCHHGLSFHDDDYYAIFLGLSGYGQESLGSGRLCSPLLGQAEARLPMAALAEVEEAADDPVHLL